MNVNVTIEIRSLVSEAPKHFKLAMASRRAAFSGNTSLVVTFLVMLILCYILIRSYFYNNGNDGIRQMRVTDCSFLRRGV